VITHVDMIMCRLLWW